MKNIPKNAIILLSPLITLGLTGCSTKGQQAQNNNPVHSEVETANETKNKALKDKPQEYSLHGQTTAKNITAKTQIGRYRVIQSKPTQAQRHLLQVMITVTIPEEIQTIGQTIHYLLKRSGYQMVDPKPEQLELTELLIKPLPEVHRRIGPMTLNDALIILAAPAFILIEDPVHRLINYQLNEQYSAEDTL